MSYRGFDVVDLSNATKKMAELLKLGAVMLAEKCPVEGCSYPLFRLKSGEVVCPVHGRVYLVKTDEEAADVKKRILLKNVLDLLEEKVLEELYRLTQDLEGSTQLIINYLEVLERVRRLKTTSS